MNHNEHIELVAQHRDVLCQQRVIDAINTDTVALESIQRNLELSLAAGGIDASSREIVEVTVNAAMLKYGVESISLESTDSPTADSQIAME